MKIFKCNVCGKELEKRGDNLEEKAFTVIGSFKISIQFKAQMLKNWDEEKEHICRRCIDEIIKKRIESSKK